MSLSQLCLALTLIFWAVIGFGWVALSMHLVYGLALVTGILLLLQGLSVFSYSTPTVKRRVVEE